MMKKNLTVVFAFLVLTSCSNDDTTPNLPDSMDDVGYISMSIKTEEKLRASGENNGDAAESTINSISVLCFDNSNAVLKVPGINSYVSTISTNSTTPAPFKINPNAEKILVIANAGNLLQGVLSGVNASSTFASINAEIASAPLSEIIGFTMINSGDGGSSPAIGDVISNPLLTIDATKIKKLADFTSESAAITAAQGDRMDITIERLAAKLELKVKSAVDLPSGASFTFQNWTVDGINSTFYPFAEKTLLNVPKLAGGKYAFNFYTKDPNFTSATGIKHTTIKADYSPDLVHPSGWMNDGNKDYVVENTMAAAEQKYGNATRIVIKGLYYPNNTWTGDWFSFANMDYETLADLQAAALTDANLQLAGDDMYTKIAAYASANTITLAGTSFATLTTADLALISNGGEVIKTTNGDPCIRWYKNGLNYYRYEIRHDNETTAEMSFGKYGVVRNNWYSLTLSKVNGAGTPWYPDINNPGPGDPEPIDPIDESVAYIGIEIETNPWIIWSNEIEI